MEAAFGRLHNSWAGAFGVRPAVLDSIVVDAGAYGAIYGTIYPTRYDTINDTKSCNTAKQQRLRESAAQKRVSHVARAHANKTDNA